MKLLKSQTQCVAPVIRTLSPVQMRACEYYSMGYSLKDTDTRFAGLNFRRLINTPEAIAYLAQLSEDYRKRSYVQKDQIVRELMLRIPDTTNNELVQITRVLAQMHGWYEEKPQQIEIEIGWAEDPDLAKRRKKIEANTIEAEIVGPKQLPEEHEFIEEEAGAVQVEQ
jgi:hypothetical protein